MFTKRFTFAIIVALLLMISTFGCVGPAQVDMIEEIEPNETAFVVPLEGSMEDQQQLMTVDYLREHQVSARRIYLQQTKIDTGRWSHNYRWAATERVIRVDRTPITQEWTADPSTGTTAKNEGLEVESLDSVGFWVGGTVTALITEEDAATYQYFYASKPLAQVINTNVRGYILGILSDEFGKRPLATEYKINKEGEFQYDKEGNKIVVKEGCKEFKSQIFKAAFESARDFFAKKGVTIESFGASQGLNYTNAEIQDAINDAFIAENDRKVAEQELEAQRIRNDKTVETATAEKEAAMEFAAAQDAAIKIRELEIAKINANANLKFAEKIEPGMLPSQILPANSPMLFGLSSSN